MGILSTILSKCFQVVFTAIVIWAFCVFYLCISPDQMGPLLLVILGATTGGQILGRVLVAWA